MLIAASILHYKKYDDLPMPACGDCMTAHIGLITAFSKQRGNDMLRHKRANTRHNSASHIQTRQREDCRHACILAALELATTYQEQTGRPANLVSEQTHKCRFIHYCIIFESELVHTQ